MRLNKYAAMLSAVSLSLSPVAASAASPLSVAHSAPSYTSSFSQDDEGESNHGGGSTAVILGVILIVLIGVAAISGDGGPNSP